MDYSQIPRQDDQNNPSGMEGQEDVQPGKRSVFMKKVKAKAMKIKNAMKKKDGNVDQDINNQNDDETVEGHEEEEVYYDDETVEEDSQVHDSSVPMHESPAVMNTAAGQNPGDKLETPAVAGEDRYDPKYPDPQTRPFSQSQDEDIGKYGGSNGSSAAMGVADVHVPEKRDSLFSPPGTFGTPGSESAGNFVHGEEACLTGQRPNISMEPVAGQRPKISMEPPTGMEEDPPAPKDQPEVSNYQSKVADPTGAGGEEAGITGMVHSFNKMNVDDKPESKSKSEEAPELYTGSQDQFSQEPIPPLSTINPKDTEDVPLDNVTKLPSNQSGYTSGISDKAIATNSFNKMNVDDEPESKSKFEEAPELYTGSQDQFSQEPIPPQSTITPKDTEDVPLDNVTKLPSNQSGYTSGISDKAIAAKNVVTSKLGYGGNQDQTAASESTQGGEEIGKSEVISDTLDARKQGGECEEGENQKPMGIVTESEEVRERLGSDEDPKREMTETEPKVASNVSPTGKGYVESVKDTVSSWWSGGGDQKQASEASPGKTHGEGEQFSSSTGEEAAAGYGEKGVGEGRLHEPSN